MDAVAGCPLSVADGLLKSAAAQMCGTQRRRFVAEVCEKLCEGSVRKAEERFGWGRETIGKGFAERAAGPIDPKVKSSQNRGRKRCEDANPQLAIEIQLIVEPQTQADPGPKIQLVYFCEPRAYISSDVMTLEFQRAKNAYAARPTFMDQFEIICHEVADIFGEDLAPTLQTDSSGTRDKASHPTSPTDP